MTDYQSMVETGRQRLEGWKAGHLSSESALAHLCGCLGVPAPEQPPTSETEIRLRKEYAVTCLQLLSRAFIGTTEEALVALEEGKTDPHVLALVREFHVFPLGTCDLCGRPAPVTDATPGTVTACAWGCPE